MLYLNLILNGNPVLYQIKANRIAETYESLKGDKWGIVFMCTHTERVMGHS